MGDFWVHPARQQHDYNVSAFVWHKIDRMTRYVVRSFNVSDARYRCLEFWNRYENVQSSPQADPPA